MFFFIEVIIQGKGKINWARIISNSLDVQLRRLIRTKTFYMSSYVIYSLARSYEYAGLVHRGVVGRGLGEIRACDSYSQLHHPAKQHYSRVNDAFTMHITRILRGIHQRLSLEAQKLIKQFGAWLIQFSKFTYIRIQGCPSPPYMLPHYPADRIVLLEVVR